MYPVEPNLCEVQTIANTSLQEYMGHWNTTPANGFFCFCSSSRLFGFLFFLPAIEYTSSDTHTACIHTSNAITLSQSVFIVQTAVDCVGRPQSANPCVQYAATTVTDPVKHVRNQGSFKSDWFTAFIALLNASNILAGDNRNVVRILYKQDSQKCHFTSRF